MAFFWQLFPFFVVVWLLILLVPVRINLYFLRENKNDFMSIRVNTFFSLLRFNIEVPFLKQETPLDLTFEAEVKAGEDELVREQKKSVSARDISLETVRRYVAYIQNNKQQLWFIARFMTRAMTVEAFNMRVRGGLQDAALTGMAAGLYWTAAGTVNMLASQWLKLRKQPEFSLSPDFHPGAGLAVQLDTTVSFRIGHLMLTSTILLLTKIRGGDQ